LDIQSGFLFFLQPLEEKGTGSFSTIGKKLQSFTIWADNKRFTYNCNPLRFYEAAGDGGFIFISVCSVLRRGNRRTAEANRSAGFC
jgi:hypothetical protein